MRHRWYRWRAWTWWLAWALAVSTTVRWSSAQVVADPVALQLKQEGDRAIESGQYAEALHAYSKAIAIEPSPALHYNRGRALQALGRNAEALAEFELFETTAPDELKAAVPDFADMVALVRQHVAEVTVTCELPGATLQMRDRSLTLPLEKPLRLDPGTFEFEVVAAGYDPWRKRVTLTGGEPRELVAKLTRADLRGYLTIESSTEGAIARVDGKEVGRVPVEIRLAPGEHSVAVSRAGFETSTTRFVLRPRARQSLSITLDELPDWYESWWFWTGVGAAVTTGVAVGIALSTERSPDRGDIEPGQITAFPLFRY